MQIYMQYFNTTQINMEPAGGMHFVLWVKPIGTVAPSAVNITTNSYGMYGTSHTVEQESRVV